MALGDPIIDLATDLLAERAERRRQLLRIGVPILGVVMTIAVILGIAVYANRANTEGALVHRFGARARHAGRGSETLDPPLSPSFAPARAPKRGAVHERTIRT